MEPVCKQALRWVMSHVPLDAALKMAGENAVHALGLDRDYLSTVAERIGALTARELTTPLPGDPPEIGLAFHGMDGPRPLDGRRRVFAHALGLT